MPVGSIGIDGVLAGVLAHWRVGGRSGGSRPPRGRPPAGSADDRAELGLVGEPGRDDVLGELVRPVEPSVLIGRDEGMYSRPGESTDLIGR